MTEPVQRFQRLQQLFGEAIALDGGERRQRLIDLTAAEPALAAELERLLQRDAAEACSPTLRPQAAMAALVSEALAPLPARIGRFEIVGELGRGGMGRVLHGIAREADLEQHAAIKVLRADVWDPHGEARLQEEARTLASLDHPGIARLLEAGRSAEGAAFVAMERVEGEPLMAWCARRRLGVRERMALFRSILQAVAHAHRSLVVHRDIKPANVMVDCSGRTRLLDFGLAKIQPRETEPRTQTAARFFTPAYAAPEQVRGERITVACDLYALGALLYELLSGVPPFALDGKTAGEAERLILDVPPDAMELAHRSRPKAAALSGRSDTAAWARQLRGDLESIVQKALRKEPLARYLSVEALDDDLARWLQLRPVRARRGRVLYRLRKFAQRHRSAVAASLLAALAALFAGQQVIEHARIAERERDRAVAALDLLSEAFMAADPARVGAGETSVRAVLEAAAARVQGLTARTPPLHAELAAQISEIRTALGLVDADGLLQPALEWAETLPAGSPVRLRLQLAAARAAVLAQQPVPAQAWLERIETEHPDLPEVELLRAHLALQNGEAAQALPRLQALLQSLQPDSDAQLRRDARWHLAEALRLSGDANAALAQLDALVAEQTASQQQAAALLTRLRRVDVLVELGQTGVAEREVRRLLPELESAYGTRSALLGMAWGSLAGALSAQERPAQAADAYSAAADAYARSVGDQHLNVARARFNAAQLKLYVDPTDAAADAQFEAAIEAASRARHALDPLPLFFRASYARHLLERGNAAAARRQLLPAMGEPDMAQLAPSNRQDLRDLLQQLFGPFDCASAEPSPQPAGGERARAYRLVCGAVVAEGPLADPDPRSARTPEHPPRVSTAGA
jgi:serine/threonine-protein kinase